MNKKWFIKKLKQKKSSQTELAKHLKIDKAGLSRMLSGQRYMQIYEIAPIAEFLGVEPIEVYNYAGGDKS